jgi:hypothetical protein
MTSRRKPEASFSMVNEEGFFSFNVDEEEIGY